MAAGTDLSHEVAPADLCRAVGGGQLGDWELVLPGFGEGAVLAAGWHFFEVSFYLKHSCKFLASALATVLCLF